MKKLFIKGQFFVFIVFVVLIIDQIIKILVKINMYWYESICIIDWFYIYFIENNGMVFGMEIFGKLFFIIFCIVVVGLIIWYLVKIVKQNYKIGYIVCIFLILVGVIGNIIDSVFYGVVFNESIYSIIVFFVLVGEGYLEWLYGKVVDMFYFFIIEINWFEWILGIGGEYFIFFSLIFNFVDVVISCGIVVLLLFYGKYLNKNIYLLVEEIKE